MIGNYLLLRSCQSHLAVLKRLLLLFSRSVVSNSLRPIDCSMPAFPMLHHLLELTQTQDHWASDAVQPSHPLLSPFPPVLASGSFPMSQLFSSGGQSTGASASASVLPVNIQDWFPLGLTGLISVQSKRLSRVFPNTTVQKYQFFSTQPSLQPNSKYVNLYKMYALV